METGDKSDYIKRSGKDRRSGQDRRTDQDKLFSDVLVFKAKVLGLVLGLILGLIIFLATNWIVIKGGHYAESGEYVIGPNLQLLSQFFIGYRVSFLGSLIGFIYGFAIGTISGSVIGWIYNKFVLFRNP